MIGRDGELRTALELVEAGASVDVVGVRMSGRTAFLDELRTRLEGVGWTVVQLRGIASLRVQPLAALQLAQIEEAPASRSTTALARYAGSLQALAAEPQTVLVVDDWDDVDEASWGVVEHTRRVTGAPLVMTRLTGRSARFTPAGISGSSSEASFVVAMSPLKFDEIEQVLMARLGASIDVGSAGRIFRKTGGVVGLAVALTDAVVREGRMRLVDGVWTAVRDLWSPGMSGLVEGYLEPLSDEARDAVEMISMLGTVESKILRDLVGWPTLEQLEERSFLSFYAAGAREFVTVQPPVLVEYFRHSPVTARRLRLSEHVNSRLGGEVTPATFQTPVLTEHDSARPHADTTFARLVHERLRARWLVAKAEWDRAPSQETAIPLILALLSFNAPDEQVAEVFGQAAVADSGDVVSVELALARAMWKAVYRDDLGGAVEDLRRTAETFPSLGRAASAIAVLVEASLQRVPHDFSEHLEIPDDAPEQVRSRIVETQVFVLTALGRFSDAIRVYEANAGVITDGSYLASGQYAIALLGVGRHAESLAWSSRAYDEAHANLDLASACLHGYAAALALVVQGDYDQANAIIATILAAGPHPPFARVNRVAVLNLAGVVAVRRGHPAMGDVYAREALALGAGPGPYPGQSAAWLAGQLAAYAGRLPEAVETLRSDAVAQWDRSFRFAALLDEVTALELDYSREESERVRALALLVDGDYFVAHLDYLDASHDEDADALLASIPALTATGRAGLSITAYEQAAALLRAHGREADAVDAEEAGDLLGATLDPARYDSQRLKTAAVLLTDREREIVDLVVEGMSNQQIATRLVLSVRTVESHVHRAMRKIGVKSRHELKYRLES